MLGHQSVAWINELDGTAQRLVLLQFNLITSPITFHVISFLVSFLVNLNESFVGVFFQTKEF